ncbi:hypothetical protein F5148DRAFT_1286436 [Russula earlei]|uniref:Uncharacterized protein n=1 Tax=Russula earlei TaxID=71964 RepID=A0ACC0U468_9AGAM|nr:hypothetical protein F5148DRAFT_1286436 [Russula earlei]
MPNALAKVDADHLEVWNCLNQEVVMANDDQLEQLVPPIEFSTHNDAVVRLSYRDKLGDISRNNHLLLTYSSLFDHESWNEYFRLPEMATEDGPPEESTSEGQSHERETAREAGMMEVVHIALLAC